MSAEYAAFSRPAPSASDFERDDAVDAAGAFAPTPIYARSAAQRRRVNPALWAIAPVAVLALGVGAYMMSAPKDDLMVSTAGPPAASASIETPRVADASTAPTMTPEAPAKDVQTFKSESVRTQVAQGPTPAARKAPVARKAVSAETAGENAAATVPTAPMAYAPTAQTSAPAPAIVTPPAASIVTPETTAPAPAPETTPQPDPSVTPQA